MESTRPLALWNVGGIECSGQDMKDKTPGNQSDRCKIRAVQSQSGIFGLTANTAPMKSLLQTRKECGGAINVGRVMNMRVHLRRTSLAPTQNDSREVQQLIAKDTRVAKQKQLQSSKATINFKDKKLENV